MAKKLSSEIASSPASKQSSSVEEKIIKLEAQLQESNARLEIANKELENFSYSVSHDLRAPLRHISGFAKLLQKSLEGRLDEKSGSYVATISGAAEKMGRLIDDLLSFSYVVRREMRMRAVSTKALVEETIREMANSLKDRNIEWKIDELPQVYGDQALLKLVLFNLISNAVKFSRPRERAEIEIGCKEEKGQVVFFIKDNGVGFDMQHAGKLFGVFQRLHTEEEFEGTGIGLANAKQIISRHGGRTWAEGHLGQGATFFFTLPKGTES
jgi:light-regulated signal transduction histidine kinase (bacteriophytochrome)